MHSNIFVAGWRLLLRWIKLFLASFSLVWGVWMWQGFKPRHDEAYLYAAYKAIWAFAVWLGHPMDTEYFPKGILTYLQNYDPYWNEELRNITGGSLLGAVVLASILLWQLATRLGTVPKSEGKNRVLRGAQLTTSRQLNRRTRVSYFNFKKRSERRNQLFIGGVAIPVELENENFLFSGRPKMGKSLALKGLAAGIRKRGQPAIVADPDSAFMTCFARDGDYLLNPFDERSAGWSPFAEIEEDFHHELMAKAVIPDSAGNDSDWRMYAQQLYSAVSRRLFEKGNPTTERLIYFLTQAGPKELGELIEGDIAGQIAAKGNEKMFSNTRGVLSMFLSGWRYLPPTGSFSVRKWIRQPGSAWLFLTYRDDQWPAMRALVSAWISLAISEGLTLPPDPNRRIWYLLEELASLERLSNLEDGANKLRKHGGCLVVNIQSVAQVRERYGRNTAQSIFSSFGTWLILGAGDAETAEEMSRHLGHQEFERGTHSTTKGEQSSSSTEGIQRDTKLLVIPAQIQYLPPREGYLSLAGNTPTAYVQIPIVSMAEVVTAFSPKKEG